MTGCTGTCEDLSGSHGSWSSSSTSLTRSLRQKSGQLNRSLWKNDAGKVRLFQGCCGHLRRIFLVARSFRELWAKTASPTTAQDVDAYSDNPLNHRSLQFHLWLPQPDPTSLLSAGLKPRCCRSIGIGPMRSRRLRGLTWLVLSPWACHVIALLPVPWAAPRTRH